MIKTVVVAILILFSLYGFWLYHRAVGAFPGEPLRPLGHKLGILVAVIDYCLLLMIPPFLVVGAGGAFLSSYCVGRLLVPALVPPGYDVEETSLTKRLGKAAHDFAFDHIFSKVAALVFVGAFPWIMGHLVGEPPLIDEYLVLMATLLPPPPLSVYEQFTSDGFAMSAWFYVGLMIWLPHRFLVQLGPLRSIVASFSGILAIARLDLATNSALDLAGGIGVGADDVALLLAGVLVAFFVDVAVAPKTRSGTGAPP